MKTVLLATSALVAFAGVAAAEVSVSGDARIGLRYDDSLVDFDTYDPVTGFAGLDTRSGWNVVSRARVIFTMTGETDSGLSFGAKLRADQSNSANRGSDSSQTAGTVFISGTYGKLTAGDADSALESAVGDLPEIGVSGLNYFNEFNYSSEFENDVYEQATLLYEYKWGDFSLYASFQDQFIGNTGIEIEGDNYALGAGYTMGNYTFGLGYENSGGYLDPVLYTFSNQNTDVFTAAPALFENENATWAISGGTSWNGFTFKAIYMDTKVDGDGEFTTLYNGGDSWNVNQFGLGVEYAMANGIELAGFWRRIDGDSITIAGVSDDHEVDVYGIGAGYDLGGGAVVKGGIAAIDGTTPLYGLGDFDRVVADFGLRLNF